jgi:hypothetical protein
VADSVSKLDKRLQELQKSRTWENLVAEENTLKNSPLMTIFYYQWRIVVKDVLKKVKK